MSTNGAPDKKTETAVNEITDRSPEPVSKATRWWQKIWRFGNKDRDLDNQREDVENFTNKALGEMDNEVKKVERHEKIPAITVTSPSGNFGNFISKKSLL